MADEQVPKTPPTQDDLLKNMKAEFDRKFSNVNETLEKQNQLLSQQLNAITQKLEPKAPAADLETLKYSDPDKYVELQTSKIKQDILNEVNATKKMDTQVQQTLYKLSADYPELQDINSELARKAIEKYNNLEDGIKNSPIAHKTAILEAAAELGVMPKSKRKTETNDDFSFSGGSNPPPKEKKRKLEKDTLIWAQLLGRDTDDPKVIEGLEKANQRTKWHKFE